LGSSILTIGLAWGSNFLFLSDLFIDWVPFYSKFRAPSSILVVVELLFPLIAIVGLYYFFHSDKKGNIDAETAVITNPSLTEEAKFKTLIYVTSGVIGISLILLIFGKGILGFSTSNERSYLPSYLLDYLIQERYSMFKTDAIKAILYVLITAGALFFALKQKISQNIALLIIGCISFFDLWTVNQNYLNKDNFVDKVFADNPFQTESSELLAEKVGDNTNLQSLLSNVNVNKTLETISEKDQGHYRIFNQVLGPFSETNTSYFKSSVGGYHAVKLRRYDDLINAYFYSSDSSKQQQIPEILNMLNTKYIIGGSAEQPQVQINPLSNGNAWFVSDLKYAKTPNEEIDAIGKTITKRTAIIAESDKEYFKGKSLAADSTASITLKKYAPNELELSTKSATPQLAVLSEIYYPLGWKMFVDNQEVPYIKANYLLRAVHVPAGEHTIKMVFEPSVITKGKIYSMISFGIFLLLSIGGLFWQFKNKNKSQVAVSLENK